MPTITSRFVDCHIFRWVKDTRATATNGAMRDEWLLLKRAPGIPLGGSWQMVSGHLDDGEKAYECALRELREETGLTPHHFYQASYVNRFYLASSDEIVLSPVFCAEVKGDAKVRISAEHTEWEWVGPEEAFERLPWPGQRKALSVLRDQFILRSSRPESCIDDLCLDTRQADVPPPPTETP